MAIIALTIDMYPTFSWAIYAETLGKIPKTRVNAFQDHFASSHLIQTDIPNIRKPQYLEQTETPMKHSFP